MSMDAMWFLQLLISPVHRIYSAVVFTIILIYSLVEVFYYIWKGQDRSFQGEVVLIVGAARGIGRQLALEFARRKSIVVLWDEAEASIERTAKEIQSTGGQAYAYKCDITDRKDIQKAADFVRSKLGDVHVLVLCSVMMPLKPFESYTSEELQKVLDVNLSSSLWILNEFYQRILVRSVGNIVFLTSIAGKIGLPNAAPYCATKFAITGLVESLKEEMNSKMDFRVTFTQAFPILKENLPESMTPCCSLLNPAVGCEEAAKTILDGLEKNEEYIFIPRIHQFLYLFFPSLSLGMRRYFSGCLNFLTSCNMAAAEEVRNEGFFTGD